MKHHSADGVKEAYICVGNESVPAPDYVLNELILKGTNRSFDALLTDERKEDYSFTLLEATYRERTGLHFDPSDYVSFGLTDKNGYLTNAGRLLADQHIVYNSRVFCTRWNGLEKGSIFDDALDDKEFEGNLIYLLQSGSDQDTTHDNMHVTTHDEKEEALIAYCSEERTREEMMAYLGLENREHFRKTYLKPLLESGRIKMTIPDKPKSKNQKYVKA